MISRLLYNELRATSVELADELNAITKEALVIWESQHLRTFTAHGKDHILQVEANLDALTRGLQNSPQKLGPHEIFVLIAACYLHDIGMQLGERDAREKHAQYAFELILISHARHDNEERRVTLPINDANARRAIAAVARAHWSSFAVQLDSEETLMRNDRGRLRLLGLLLATADLLDLSPVRAIYFRSIHQLDKLDAMAELHQSKHELVKGFRIHAPDPLIPEELQYFLEWCDDSEATRTLSDLELHWFHAQQRTVAPLLLRESGGRVRWSKPWVATKFCAPIGPIPRLSDKAANILRAERANQLRINRDKFTREFEETMQKGEVALFRFPSDVQIDGKPVVEWCESHAKLRSSIKVARMDIQPTAAIDQASIVANILEQWGEHLARCSDDEALKRIRRHSSAEAAFGLVTILVVAGPYDAALLAPIIDAAMQRPSSTVARVVLLLALAADGPARIDFGAVSVSNGAPFEKADVVQHLQNRWGLDPRTSEETYTLMKQIGVADQPSQVYEYVKGHCGILASRIA